MIDETDLKILRVIQDTPEISVTDLAQRIGLSHTPCWRRLKQLEASGAVAGRAVLLDAAMMGLGVTVFAHLRLRAHDAATLEALECAARERPEIMECFSMSGESDYILRIVVGSIDEYEQLLRGVVLQLPGVAAVVSNFALKCVKNTTKLPI